MIAFFYYRCRLAFSWRLESYKLKRQLDASTNNLLVTKCSLWSKWGTGLAGIFFYKYRLHLQWRNTQNMLDMFDSFFLLQKQLPFETCFYNLHKIYWFVFTLYFEFIDLVLLLAGYSIYKSLKKAFKGCLPGKSPNVNHLKPLAVWKQHQILD